MPSSVWSGHLTFGLISMPVRLFSGARSSGISFHMLHRPDKQRVAESANDALGVSLRPLNGLDVGLTVPAGELDFDTIAAPAGLARMSW